MSEEEKELSLFDELQAPEQDTKKILGALIGKISILGSSSDWENYINAVDTLEAVLSGYLAEDSEKTKHYRDNLAKAVKVLMEKQKDLTPSKYYTINEARNRQMAIDFAKEKFKALNIFLTERGFYPRDTLK